MKKNERDYEHLNMLLETPSPSGHESTLINTWFNYLTRNENEPKLYYQDKLGQKAVSVGNGPIKVLLTAHIDSVFARVSHVDSHGLVHLKHTGGTDREAFVCGNVIILGRKGEVYGIVGKAPIHINDKQTEHKYTDLKEVVVNVGAETKEEAEQLGIISGVPVIYERNINLNFGEHRIHATELDDKIGVYIITKIFEFLTENKGEWFTKYTVIVAPLCQEEVGGMGAYRMAKNINPDICFNFDVDHAQDYIQVHQNEVGDIELGKGGIIQFGCDKSQRIVDLLINNCEAWNIPYQTNASKNRGTDTVHFQTETTDCETMLISIPNIYMHTTTEMCDWRDVDSIINMVAYTITACDL